MAAFFLCFILLFSICSSAQNTGNISIGASITAGGNSTPWRSPSGDFAFGFQQLPNNEDLFVLSIWFDKIPNKTVVWYEKDSYPVPRGSTVRLDPTDGIVLRDPQGTSRYRSNGLNGRPTNGFMNDTGNLVLQGNGSTSLWESFNNPTDTLLPTQRIQINGQLISRVTVANFSQGRFYARMTNNGNFVLNTKVLPSSTEYDDEYFTSQTSDTNASNSGSQLVFDESASLSVLRRNGQREVLSPSSIPPPSDNYYRVSLDYDGLFVQYYHPKDFNGNPDWAIARSWPADICTEITGDTGSGACGYNSICRIQNGRPACQCPPQFSLADPNNAYGDCMPNYVQTCVPGDQQGSSDNNYEFSELSDTDWPKNDYETVKPSTEEECRNRCLNDCLCGVAIFRSNQCWKKRLPLSNGRVENSLGVVKAFLKFRKGDAPLANNDRPSADREPKKDHGTLVLVLSVLLGGSVFFICSLMGAWYLGFLPSYNKKPNQAQHTSGPNLCCFTYEELAQATDGFKEELGRGSFGIVYKGMIPMNGSDIIVAVKKLDRVAQDTEKEFKTEVNVIGQTHHKNLVGLVGFCREGPHRLLVYEYMSNGTLAGFLFGDSRPSWSQRTHIALGVARGLIYLHEECNTQIIHCDIKPQNILLDGHYNARISDFGLAKLLMMNQSRTLTNIRGTKGYVAPEWFRNTQVTVKVDVYSFGVLLLEIITCRKSVNQNMEFSDGENPILTDWVWDCFSEGRVESVGGNDEEALKDRSTLERFVMVGIWCIQEDASLRPTMRIACQMLEGIIQVPVPPSPYHIYNYTSFA